MVGAHPMTDMPASESNLDPFPDQPTMSPVLACDFVWRAGEDDQPVPFEVVVLDEKRI